MNDTSTVFGKDIDVRGSDRIWAGSKRLKEARISQVFSDDVSFVEILKNFLKCFTSKKKCSSNTYGKENRNNDLSALRKASYAGANDAQRDLPKATKSSSLVYLDEVLRSQVPDIGQMPNIHTDLAERLKRDHKGDIHVPEMKSRLCYSDGVSTPNLKHSHVCTRQLEISLMRVMEVLAQDYLPAG